MKIKESGIINQSDSMYPSVMKIITDGMFTPSPYSTTYCVVMDGEVSMLDHTWKTGEYFSMWSGAERFRVNGTAWFVCRIGFRGQDMTGHGIEDKGRLTYIDNCSSTILVYPPRYGDPSLHLLYFPKGIDQSFHTHPSIRMGLVHSGRGKACLQDEEMDLLPGKMFCLDEQEVHRFRTDDSEMRIIAYHPDGNWGPTDEAHPMLNRTFVVK